MNDWKYWEPMEKVEIGYSEKQDKISFTFLRGCVGEKTIIMNLEGLFLELGVNNREFKNNKENEKV
jgi:hypothetical protein